MMLQSVKLRLVELLSSTQLHRSEQIAMRNGDRTRTTSKLRAEGENWMEKIEADYPAALLDAVRTALQEVE